MDINNITIVGRVGKDPDARTVGDKKKVELRVANNRGRGRNDQEQTNWYTVELWGPSAGFAEQYISKGDMVCVTGSHLLSEYDGKDGKVTLNLIQQAQIQKLNRTEESSEPPQRQQYRGNDRRQDRQPPRQQQTRRQDEEESDW